MSLPTSPTPTPTQRVSFWTPRTSLIVLILLLVILVGWQAMPYLSGVLGALTIYALLRNQMRGLVERYHWRRSVAASLLVFEALIIFLIPLAGVVLMLIDVFSTFDPASFTTMSTQALDIVSRIEDQIGVDLWNEENIRQLTALSTTFVQVLIRSTSSFFMNGFIILFMLYFMLRGYKQFECAVMELLPFTKKNKEIVARETIRIVRSNAIGIPVLGIIQGVFAYVGYLFFGVSNPLFYAILTTFTTVVPILGTMIVWIPLGGVMILSGSWLHGLLLLAYGFIIIGGVDNVARFLMQRQMADIHPLITIFGVFIGLPLFGFWGVIFGPLILSLIVLFLNLYRHDYVPGSKARPSVSDKKKKDRNLERLSIGMQRRMQSRRAADEASRHQEESSTDPLA